MKSETQITQQQDSTKVAIKNVKPEQGVKDLKKEKMKDKNPSYSSVLSLNFIFHIIYKYTFREF